MKLYKLDIKNNYSVSKRIVNFLNPEYSCALLRNFSDIEKINKVYKSKLLEANNLDSFSSISGELKGLVKIEISGKPKKALFINNDFKENNVTFVTKKISSVESFMEFIKGSIFYKKFNNKSFKNIIINSIIDEPFNITESYILKLHSDKLIETISYLNEVFNFDKSIVVFKNTENDNIGEYLSKTGSFTHMSLYAMDDLFLLEQEDILLEKINYKKSESIVFKPSELLELRHFLKTNCYMCEKYISVVNTINKKTKIVFVKKNVIVSELLNKLKLLSSDYEYIKNGAISGIKINANKEIISNDFSALYIVKKKKEDYPKCINCGKCVSVCPNGVNPKKVYFSKVKDPRCTNCGLCILMCPANINLKKVVKK